MRSEAFLLEAHHTTHIEGTRLTLEDAADLLAGRAVPGADPDDARELLNYRDAFAFVSTYLNDGGLPCGARPSPSGSSLKYTGGVMS